MYANSMKKKLRELERNIPANSSHFSIYSVLNLDTKQETMVWSDEILMCSLVVVRVL